MGTGPHDAPTLALGPTCTELMGALDTHPVRLLWRRLKPAGPGESTVHAALPSPGRSWPR